MKWLVYIFSCYILLLSCIPCNDAAEVVLQRTARIARLDVPHEHESQPDYCSPLCICSCCNVQVTAEAISTVHFYHHQVLISYPIIPANPLPSQADNIWQPPRLV
ncbi:DUF6660 family protein [Chitinophaga nivalis]|uniref:Secreted protein n=1 Tax=Chitinophaga nivalis TaxID=2991709 RepID=A0ABT3IL70_9BACT|nr:DUF6660 family protein [Chitinophaga nivalis]MCW3465631.1 hypothetical protein [Chitinophaga nivalis]MCW3484678.1 hypothetical protein [Chitinophaga nivalis]